MRYDEREFDVTHDLTQVSEDDLLAAVREHSNESGSAFVPSLGHQDLEPEAPH